jgi:hypothetical protein
MSDKAKCKWCGAPAVIADSYGAVCATCWLKGKQVKESKDAEHRKTTNA